MLGRLSDDRVDEAMEMLAAAQRDDGRWRVSGRRYWRPGTEVVDWGDAHEMVTSAARAILE